MPILQLPCTRPLVPEAGDTTRGPYPTGRTRSGSPCPRRPCLPLVGHFASGSVHLAAGGVPRHPRHPRVDLSLPPVPLHSAGGIPHRATCHHPHGGREVHLRRGAVRVLDEGSIRVCAEP